MKTEYCVRKDPFMIKRYKTLATLWVDMHFEYLEKLSKDISNLNNFHGNYYCIISKDILPGLLELWPFIMDIFVNDYSFVSCRIDYNEGIIISFQK